MQHRRMETEAYAVQVVRFKAGQLVGKAGLTKSDRKDLEQELTLDLMRRAQKYDPKRAGRKTFAARIVERHAATILRRRLSPTRDVRREGPSLNETIAGEDGCQVECVATIDAQTNRQGRRPEELQQLVLDVQAVVETLPRRLKALAEGLKTHSVTEVVEHLGLSRRQIYRLMKKVQRRFDDAGLRGYVGRRRTADSSRRGKNR